jgi:hypothetical protein
MLLSAWVWKHKNVSPEALRGRLETLFVYPWFKFNMFWKLSKDNKAHRWKFHAPPCLLAQWLPFSYKPASCGSRIDPWWYSQQCLTVYWYIYKKYNLSHVVDGLLARSQYPECPAIGHLGIGYYWFPYAYKRMLRWFPIFQVATACFSCSPTDLNFLDPYFIFIYMHYNHCHWVTAH